MPMPGTNKNSNPLIAIPGQLPLPHQRPKGCHFGPRCSYFLDGVCDDAKVPMLPIFGQNDHFSRCLRVDAIDWSHRPRDRRAIGADRDRRRGSRRRQSEETLSGRGLPDIRRARGAHGQGGRGHQLRRQRGRDRRDRRRIRLRQIDARQSAARAGDRDRRHGLVRSSRHSGHADRAARRQDDRAPFR